MGFFRDIAKVTRQAQQIRDETPIAERFAGMQQMMAQAQDALGSITTDGANAVLAVGDGVDAVATITGSRQTNAQMNLNPVIEFDLLVMLPSGVPVPVTCRQAVQQLHLVRAQPGCRLAVKVDPTAPERLWINWAAPAP